MNKRWVALTVALTVISLGSAGASVAVSAQPPELVIWIQYDHPINIEMIANAFERDHELSVRVEMIPEAAEMRARFFEEGASGTGPDIIADTDEMLDQYRAAVGIEPVMFGSRATEYVPFAIQSFSRADQLYAVPYAFENVAFVRNTRLVPDVPPTWEDVMNLSRDIHESGAAEYGFVMQDHDFYHFFPILTAFGGYVFGLHEDGTFNPMDRGLGNEGTFAALTWVQNMAQAGLLPPDMDWDTAHESFVTEKAAMIITGPWAIGWFEEAGIPFAVSAFPAGVQPGNPWVHVHGFMVNANSPHRELAQRFVSDYLATQPAMQAIYESIRRVPAHLGVFEQIDDPVVLGFAEALQNGQRMPAIPEMDPVWETMANAIQQVRLGSLDPKTALDEALARIDEQNSSQ